MRFRLLSYIAAMLLLAGLRACEFALRRWGKKAET